MNALSIHNLTKVYKEGALALKSINLEVEAGDFFALLGPNGAGKTTLIGIINSLNKKTSGTVSIFNHDIDTDFIEGRRILGVVPQEFNLSIFDTVEKVLLLHAGYYGVPLKQAKERMEFYLKALDLWSKRKSTIRHLSGGMKRRVMIVRALLHHPKLLLLDEPSVGVDIELRYQMWNFLRELNQNGTTIILTTHYLEEAEALCRNLAIIDRGEIIEKSSMEDLLHKLNKEIFILNMSSPISKAPDISFACKLQNEKILEVEVPNTRTINELFTELMQQGIVVLTMENKMSRLENLFMTLTRERSL